MEGGLFAKYQILLHEAEKEKEIISQAIFTEIGITVSKKKIKIKEKEIILVLSSSERMMFTLKGGEKKLQERGYRVLLR